VVIRRTWRDKKMGYILTFLAGGVFGIVLLSLLIVAKESDARMMEFEKGEAEAADQEEISKEAGRI